MSISITVEIPCGTNIKNACKEVIDLAHRLNIIVKFEFNDKIVFVFPYTDLDSLLQAYKKSTKNNNEFVCTNPLEGYKND